MTDAELVRTVKEKMDETDGADFTPWEVSFVEDFSFALEFSVESGLDFGLTPTEYSKMDEIREQRC